MAGSGAALLLCGLLALVALSAQHALYTTTLEKSAGVTDAAPMRTSSFTIPSGQCSGLIDQSLLCGGAAAAVRVAVRDAAYATLRIDDALRSATVTRARCGRAADVELRVACRPTAAPAPAAARRARSPRLISADDRSKHIDLPIPT